MKALDFEYDGKYLSEYNFIICDFSFSSGANVVSAGSKLTFDKVSRNGGRRYGLAGTKYNECITTTFDICKNPDIFEDRFISDDEQRELMRWLNRKEYLRTRFVNDDVLPRYYDATFNVEKILVGEELCGLRLTMETNRPYAYGMESKSIYSVTTSGQQVTLIDVSDDIGEVSPIVKITCNSDGDISLVNNTLGVTTYIQNCTAGEIIELNCETQIISTSLNSHDIYDDFNYEFFRIGNTINNRANEITVSLPCTLEISYHPIIKDAP